MNLTNKLKKTGKVLALAGMLANPVYDSGCVPVALVTGAAIVAKGDRDAAEIEAKSREDAAEIEARARRDAAEIEANANRPQIVYVPQQTGISRQNRFFAAKRYKGDLNRDNAFNFEEYDGAGNIFEPNQPILFAAEIVNREGAILETTCYKLESHNLKPLLQPDRLNILWDYYTFYSAYNGLSEGTYCCTYKIGDETIGSTIINVETPFVNK